MYHYIELSCLPDEGVPAAFIMGKVMDIVHLCLVNLQKEVGHNPVGLSFPEYRYDLDESGKLKEKAKIGTKLRLFSLDNAHLERLNLKAQLRRLEDYVHQRQSSIERPNLNFATFERVQVRSSVERLVRRRMKSTGVSEEVAQAAFKDFKPMLSDLPFVHLHSQSNEQAFRLFIRKQVAAKSESWQFSSYGLSQSVAVPDF
ncbi:type I-F CRISPR-associated endoribonuclease Cas6/Csy4 [Thiolinea disciformis]|uniref:type I-F CRISPR-associated endoribonuclease Cas6/Csy4 n=1 Tax=Thiolinea disciformis TaxID=125614 RepID=UPI000372432F|nr:type I-F CRISPR-associated endoribonuclease Cas6/Csy4 [Thiolinea disciformis]